MLVRIAFVAAVTVCVFPLLYGPVLAQVPRIQGQGTAASGMGNAFSAQADDPSALHYNPAGMTQLRGVEFLTGALLSGGTTTFTSPTGVTATGDRDGSLAWPPPTHLYLTANLKDLGIRAFGDLTAGIGVTVPFGSVTRWPNDGPFRTATTFNTLPLLDIKPTVAYRLTNDLSIGLGADIYTFSGLFGEGHVERKSVWPGGGGILAGAQVELFGADNAEAALANVQHIVQSDEVDGFFVEAVPARAERILSKSLAVQRAIIAQHIMFAGDVEDVPGLDLLQILLERIELFHLREMTQIARVQDEIRGLR